MSATGLAAPPRRPARRRLVPTFDLGSRRARHVVARSITVYRRGWYFVVGGVLEPLFYLASIGVGLSHLVGGVRFQGHVLPYTWFAAPGLLASSAMNGALIDTTYNVFYRLKVARSYDAVLATPLSTGDVALGEVGWATLRGTLYSLVFLATMAGLGYVGSYWALLCVPAAALVAAAFAAGGMAATCYLRSWADLDNVAFLTLPVFLFSATFYPVTVYPSWLAWIVRLSPLYQGVTLERALDTGLVGASTVWHAAYLVLLAIAAGAIVARRLSRTLTP